jgi:hypothetical protein
MTLAATEFLAALASMCCPEGSSASATSAISPVPIVLRCSRLQLPCPSKSNLPLTNSQLFTWCCPRCGANVNIRPSLTSQQLAFRCRLPDSS